MSTAPTGAPEAIRRSRLSEDVAKRIEHLILEKLSPGEKLPPERQLAEMFGVSRSSVRDAVRTLELMGLLERRQGSGTVARDLSAESLINPLATMLVRKRELVLELLDVRKIIEPPLAARAALHASAEEIAELEEILDRQAKKTERGEAATEEDSGFHYGIAMAAQNSVVLKVVDVLMELLRETRVRGLQVPGRPQKSLAGHRRILAAIKRHNARAAEAASRRHIQEIEKLVKETL